MCLLCFVLNRKNAEDFMVCKGVLEHQGSNNTTMLDNEIQKLNS